MTNQNFNIEVKINLPSLEPRKLDAAINKALRASALHLEGAAKDNITPFTRTGRLRSSIQTKINERRRQAVIGTRVVYARPVEFGHHSFRGHHYMRNTARQQRRRVVEIFERHLRAEL